MQKFYYDRKSQIMMEKLNQKSEKTSEIDKICLKHLQNF